MKILAVSCSPRKEGNTETMLKEAAQGALSAGAGVEFIRLQDMAIEPCRECMACSRTGRCVIDDDMQALQRKLIEMDGIIMAAPMFFMGIPARGKAFIDRCQPFWAAKYVLSESLVAGGKEGRKGLFLSVGGTEFKHLFDGALKVVKSMFSVIDVEHCGDVLLRKVDEKGDILKHPDVMAKCRELGAGLVR